MKRWSDQCFQYFATVINSFMPFIWNAPSPTSAITGRSGYANLAPIAYGTPEPIVAKPPECEAIMPRRIFRSRAYQLVPDPESLVRMQRSGRRGDSSQNTRCG